MRSVWSCLRLGGSRVHNRFSAFPVVPFSVSWKMPLRLRARVVDFVALKHLGGFSVALKSDQDNSWVTSLTAYISVVFNPLTFGVQRCRRDWSQTGCFLFQGTFSLSACALASFSLFLMLKPYRWGVKSLTWLSSEMWGQTFSHNSCTWCPGRRKCLPFFRPGVSLWLASLKTMCSFQAGVVRPSHTLPDPLSLGRDD